MYLLPYFWIRILSQLMIDANIVSLFNILWIKWFVNLQSTKHIFNLIPINALFCRRFYFFFLSNYEKFSIKSKSQMGGNQKTYHKNKTIRNFHRNLIFKIYLIWIILCCQNLFKQFFLEPWEYFRVVLAI